MAWFQSLNDFDAPIYDDIAGFSSFGQQFDELTHFVCQMQACRICSVIGHSTELCPMLREDSYEHNYASSVFPEEPQTNYDPYSNAYNLEWRDHHDFSYGNSPILASPNFSNYELNDESYPNIQQHDQSFNSDLSLEYMFQSFITNTSQLQQEMNASIHNMNTQMEQMIDAVSRLEVRSDEELPSHTMVAQKVDEDEIVLSGGNEAETNKELEDAIPNDLGSKEEVQRNHEFKGVKTKLNSLPVIFHENKIFPMQLYVTHDNSFDLQAPIPSVKFLPSDVQSIFLEVEETPSYEPTRKCNLPMKNNVKDGVLKIHEIGVT